MAVLQKVARLVCGVHGVMNCAKWAVTTAIQPPGSVTDVTMDFGEQIAPCTVDTHAVLGNATERTVHAPFATEVSGVLIVKKNVVQTANTVTKLREFVYNAPKESTAKHVIKTVHRIAEVAARDTRESVPNVTRGITG